MNTSCRLDHRGIIRIIGKDRRAFLQGLITNDIELCRGDHAIYAALLSPQGKFLHDLFIVEKDDHFLVDCEAARSEDLLKRLMAYKLRAKVAFEDATTEFEIWADQSPTATMAGVLSYLDPRLPLLGTRSIHRKTSAETGTSDAYERNRLTLGVADGSRDLLIEKSTLSDGNIDLLNGVSWTKGCYVGQELTARMHYRALVKKRLFPVMIEGSPPPRGSLVLKGEEEIGEMRSSQGDRGLALLNIETVRKALEQKIVFACGNSAIRAAMPSWMNVS